MRHAIKNKGILLHGINNHAEDFLHVSNFIHQNGLKVIVIEMTGRRELVHNVRVDWVVAAGVVIYTIFQVNFWQGSLELLIGWEKMQAL